MTTRFGAVGLFDGVKIIECTRIFQKKLT
uniref:Uncharacterized protein n=1 Tax=Triticum urartu TaxID=4572 RepID=A0A8R7PF81_TRIUA